MAEAQPIPSSASLGSPMPSVLPPPLPLVPETVGSSSGLTSTVPSLPVLGGSASIACTYVLTTISSDFYVLGQMGLGRPGAQPVGSGHARRVRAPGARALH